MTDIQSFTSVRNKEKNITVELQKTAEKASYYKWLKQEDDDVYCQE